MDPARMTVRVRPRSAWEGIDLGFVMARRWFLPLWTLWWLGALPMNLLLILALVPLEFGTWVPLLAWWLKPAYEPPLVFWLSRALFGERLPARAVVGNWRRTALPQLVANLTWRRLSPSRSFSMPIVLLEGLGGDARRRRLALLGRRQNAPFWLTFTGVHFEMAMEVSALLLLVLLVPEELRWMDLATLFLDGNPVTQSISYAVALLAMSLFAPFYVAGGFALYLTRRTELEAWDVELVLRRLAARSATRPRPGLTIALLFAAGLIFGLHPGADAGELTPGDARQAIDAVLAHEDFGRTETIRVFEPKDPDQSPDNPPWNLEDWLAALEDVFRGVALVIEILLWGAAALLLALLTTWLVRHRDWLPRTSPGQPGRQPPPARLFGLDIGGDSLPADIAGAARDLADQGAMREALSLLYRGALSRLVQGRGLGVPESATEGECLALVCDARPAAEAQLFGGLTLAWTRLAYGHLPPGEGTLDALCTRWAEIYGDGAAD